MYGIAFAILIGIGAFLVLSGVNKRKSILIAGGAILGCGTIFLVMFMEFHTELLWFQSLGYGERFWKIFLVKLGAPVCAGLFAFVVVWMLTRNIFQKNRWSRWIPSGIALIVSAQWGLLNWETILRFIYRVNAGIHEPIYGKDAGFYLFSLPFYDALFVLFMLIAGIGVVSTLVSYFLRINIKKSEFYIASGETGDNGSKEFSPRSYIPLYLNVGVLLLVIAWGFFLKRYHLMYSTHGAVTGPGWTDVHIRSWAYGVMGVITAVSWLVVLIPPVHNRIKRLGRKYGFNRSLAHIPVLAVLAVALFGIYVAALTVMPGILQRLRVEPNEITFERSYIENNIGFTRHGFNLHNIEERRFPASDVFKPETIDNEEDLFSNIRLWDWRALDAVYKQFQEIRLYYEFQDVDIDRYTIDGKYRQVMVSARELNLENLPAQSRTFVNERFKYTHGYGITLTTVNEFTPQGLPNLLIKDIPPTSAYPSLNVKQPRIYYGEATDSHVIVNSIEKEFDYPSGDRNVYTRYDGGGGVALSSTWRKIAYGWKFDGIRLLLSDYPTPESRIMFRRNILERVRKLAPFLEFDKDPYIVLAGGELKWIIDAYTVSDRFPYSEHFQTGEFVPQRAMNLDRLFSRDTSASSFSGINYIRNSVKCVVDAYEGAVTFYVFDEKDPLIRVWWNVFPDLFKSHSEMSKELLAHVRYPSGMLLVQGLVYAKYHMTDPEVFYNQEDLWIRATEKYYNQVVPVQPYYILWKSHDSEKLEFSLILPFTPKKRQVMIGWIAGLCDPGNYGKMIAYQFPKERRVLGPQQVETKIDQDRHLSGQLTLWDQRGSNVIRGNVLAIPTEDTILYVEPIYLQAETAAYPELRLVAVMHNDNLSYAESFDKALRGLFDDQKQPRAKEQFVPTGQSFDTLVNDADKSFENYLRALGEKRYTDAAKSLEALEGVLRELKKNVDEGSSVPGKDSTTKKKD